MSTADAPGQVLGPVGLCRVGGPGRGALRHPQSSGQLGTSDLGGKGKRKS